MIIATRVHKRVRLMLVKLRTVLRDRDKKSISRIMTELAITAFRLRCVPLHYFTHFLYRRSIENYLDYICGKESLQIHRTFHNRDTLDILDNKLLFHEHFAQRGLYIPKRLGYNLRNMWFPCVGSDVKYSEVRTADEFVNLMKNLFQCSGCTSIFAKPIRGSGGSGTIKIKSDIFLPVVQADCSQLFHTITGGCYIFQEQIIQHSELSRLHPSSLNTIRIDTFLDDNNKPEVISAYLRIGISGSVVDNLRAGGLFAGIDIMSGRLQENARTKIEMGGMVYSNHPDSGIEFKEFAIPFFEEVKVMACQAARVLPEKLVGWDIGIGVDGPVLIEGNGWYEITFSQIAFGGYRRNPVFRKVMKTAGLQMRISLS